MTQTEKALEFCNTDELLYSNMKDCILKGDAHIVCVEDDGLLLVDKPSGIRMFACKNVDTGREILKKLTPADVNGNSKWMESMGETSRKVAREVLFADEDDTTCYQVVWKKEKAELSGLLEFRKATKKELEIIKVTYDRESPENLEKLCAEKKIDCAFLKDGEKDVFVGFIGTHPEGSMGMLFIFDEYRRRGFAEETEKYLINEILDSGRIPYAHIIYDNYKSLNLQKKLGFEVAKEFVFWQRIPD